MGVKIFELCKGRELGKEELKGKKLAIDASIFLYQFLATIRGRDGTLLTDSKGRITSHLVGLLARTTNFMKQGMLPCYVFDGKPPELKRATLEARAKIKAEAQKSYEKAEEEQDIEAMKKFSARTMRLTKEMTEEAKEVIEALGLPVINAPSEGEAQAAHMAIKGDVWAVVSQDADCLIFGAPRLLRNLGVTGKRKKTGALSYDDVLPELIELKQTLAELEITQDQLIVMSMLIGTDYNPGGIKGIGQHKALKLVKENGNDFEKIFQLAKWDENDQIPWKELFSTFKKIPVTDDYKLVWKKPNIDKLRKILVEEHDFSEERIQRAAFEVSEQHKGREQSSLGAYF